MGNGVTERPQQTQPTERKKTQKESIKEVERMIDEKIPDFLKGAGYKDEQDFYERFDHLKNEMGGKSYLGVKEQVKNFLRIMTLSLGFYGHINKAHPNLTIEEKIKASIISITLTVNMLGYKAGVTEGLENALNKKMLDCDSSSFLLGSFLLFALNKEIKEGKVEISYMNAFLINNQTNEKKEDKFFGHTNLIIENKDNGIRYLVEATNIISNNEKAFPFFTQVNMYFVTKHRGYKAGDENQLFEKIPYNPKTFTNDQNDQEFLQYGVQRFEEAGLIPPGEINNYSVVYYKAEYPAEQPREWGTREYNLAELTKPTKKPGT